MFSRDSQHRYGLTQRPSSAILRNIQTQNTLTNDFPMHNMKYYSWLQTQLECCYEAPLSND